MNLKNKDLNTFMIESAKSGFSNGSNHLQYLSEKSRMNLSENRHTRNTGDKL